MVEPEFGEWWGVFDICDVGPVVADQLTSIDEYTLATGDILEFYEVLVRMILNPYETYRRYGASITGLNDLQTFLSSENCTLTVSWNYSSFRAERNEFGTVIIGHLTTRSREKRSCKTAG